MIRNRNTVWNKAGDSSRNQDKGIKAPNISNASLPTASTDYEGFIAYDKTNSKLVFCTGTAWETVTSAE
jgi:hypothetical protein